MKILYAIQASGKGNINRANEIIPYLEDKCEVDILVSGKRSDIQLNHIIKFRRKGISMDMRKKGIKDFSAIFKQLQSPGFRTELSSIPVEKYDVVITDFEPLSAWACKLKNVPCIGVGHYQAIMNNSSPLPKKSPNNTMRIFKYFIPVNAGIGMHYLSYAESMLTPIIRKEIRNAYHRNNGHYCVYLPFMNHHKIIEMLQAWPEIEWHIFVQDIRKSYSIKNCWIRPSSNYDFTSSFTTCEGLICAAVFDTTAEAIFMKKKLLVIPAKGDFEQSCNAIALKEMGITILKNFKRKQVPKINSWLKTNANIHMNYTDNAKSAAESIISLCRQLTLSTTSELLNEVS